MPVTRADPFVQFASKEVGCECESLRERANWKALNALSGGGGVVQTGQENCQYSCSALHDSATSTPRQ